MSQTLNTRTVKANGDAIKRLRIKKGWRQTELAKHVKCSLKTAINVERGANVYLYTINKFANALKVDPVELMVGEEPPEQKPKERVWNIQIRLATPHGDFDETDDLPKLLQALIERLGGPELEPKSVRSGSTEVVMAMTLHQIIKLIEAYKDGKLDSFNIQSITAPTDFTAKPPDRDASDTSFYLGTSHLSGSKMSWELRFPELMENAMAYDPTISDQTIESEQSAE